MFFGIVMTLASLVFAWMRWYAAQQAKIMREDLTPAYLKKATRQSFLLGPTAYLTATLATLLHEYLAIALYALIPLYFILPRGVEDKD